MKKIGSRLCALLLICLTMTSCNEKEEVSFDISLIVGKWVSGTEYYRYDADGTGATWDTADDVSEEEAQAYTWEYDGETNKLTLIHQMEMGGVVPKYYTLVTLNATTLAYQDQYSNTSSFTRAN